MKHSDSNATNVEALGNKPDVFNLRGRVASPQTFHPGRVSGHFKPKGASQ
jgi:hypothetical protein